MPTRRSNSGDYGVPREIIRAYYDTQRTAVEKWTGLAGITGWSEATEIMFILPILSPSFTRARLSPLTLMAYSESRDDNLKDAEEGKDEAPYGPVFFLRTSASLRCKTRIPPHTRRLRAYTLTSFAAAWGGCNVHRNPGNRECSGARGFPSGAVRCPRSGSRRSRDCAVRADRWSP